MCFIHAVHLSHVLNPALFYNNPFPYPLVDLYQNSSQKAATTSTENYLPVLITKSPFFFLHKRRYITESERSPLFLEEKNANAIFFQNLYRMQSNRRKNKTHKKK